MLSAIVKLVLLFFLSRLVWGWIRPRLFPNDIDKVRGPDPTSRTTGNFSQLFATNTVDIQAEWLKKYGRVWSATFMFGRKVLFVADPLALYHIIIKDQYIYEEQSNFIDGNYVVFGDSLLSTIGEQHRKQRKILNPVFSIAHLRRMTGIFVEVADRLRTAVALKTQNGPHEIDMMNWLSRTAMELIGQSGLGYSFDPLTDGTSPHPYGQSIKDLIPAYIKLIPARVYILPWARHIGTPAFRRAVVDFVSRYWKNLRRLRDIVDIMHHTSVDILNEKRKALEQGDGTVQGKNIISILLRANMEADAKDKLSEEEVLGQLSTLIFGATDTTSSALCRTLCLLATHPEIQGRLREEINSLRQERQDLTYDNLESLSYLEAVCRETLRVYPPILGVLRTAQKDMILPLSNPITGRDGQLMNQIHVPKDTDILVSIVNSNRDPSLWGLDAHEWKPERWLKPLPEAVTEARVPGVYSHMMTFIGGGRACIGFKFSQLEMKVVLVTLIENFTFEMADKEIVWQVGGISTPYVAGEENQGPKLPMKVARVQ